MWTYDTGNLTTVDEDGRKNIVRLLIGDTDSNDPQLQDEEILFALSSNKDNPNVAAIFAVNAIISKYARLVNIELDEAIREDYSDLIDNYKGLLSGLEKKVRLSNNSIRIYATGLTLTDFEEASRVTRGATAAYPLVFHYSFPFCVLILVIIFCSRPI